MAGTPTGTARPAIRPHPAAHECLSGPNQLLIALTLLRFVFGLLAGISVDR